MKQSSCEAINMTRLLFAAMSLCIPISLSGTLMHMVGSEGTAVGHKGFYPTSLCEYLRRGYETAGYTLCQLPLYMIFGDYIKQNYENKFYNKSRNICKDITEKYNVHFEQFDVLVMPTMPVPARELPLAEMTIKEQHERTHGVLVNTSPYNYTGHPAITINAGFLDGLPVGVMIVGKHFDDGTVLKVAHALEQALKEKV